MSGFRVATASSRPDPFKRVKYSLGLVLGVDEFEQEQAYFLEADRRHNRSLHGYGTVCGLRVTRDGPEVRVGPGLAVSPKGREIRLPAAHCASIDAWLAVPENRERLQEAPALPSLPPGTHSLYVTLCYLECETDDVPIPGTPCRSEDESMAPSRITESFDLKFSTAPPDQTEEEAIKAFGRLLDRLWLTSDPADEAIDKARMADEVRALLGLFPTDGSEPAEPDDAPLFVRPDEVDDVLDAALSAWVTEVRPALLPDGKNCSEGPPDEDCVLLARIDFAVDDAWRVDPESVRVVEDDRPYLVQTRLLEELVRHLSKGVTDHGKLAGLEDDDHPQYLPVDPKTRALKRNLDAGGKLIRNLKPGTKAGEAVTAEVAVKVNDPAGGDLDGAYPNPSVAGLRGAPVVDDPKKAGGWVLTWTGKDWAPRPVEVESGGVALPEVAGKLPTLPFVTVTRAPRQLPADDPDRFLPTFELWFHLDVDDVSRANLPRLIGDFAPEVFVETPEPAPSESPYLRPVKVVDVREKDMARNVFFVLVDEEIDLHREVRFVFHVKDMAVEVNGKKVVPLADWLEGRPVKWVGHDGGGTITAFYKNDVRQKVIASGMYDLQGRIYTKDNLQLTRPTENVPIDGEFLTWDGYDVLKWYRYIVKGAPFWLDEKTAMDNVMIHFQVLTWHKEGVFVATRDASGSRPRQLVGVSVEISELL